MVKLQTCEAINRIPCARIMVSIALAVLQNTRSSRAISACPILAIYGKSHVHNLQTTARHVGRAAFVLVRVRVREGLGFRLGLGFGSDGGRIFGALGCNDG